MPRTGTEALSAPAAPTACAAMAIPANTVSGSCVSSARSLKVPGSPSSALQMMYLVAPGAARQVCHLVPVGNPAPPLPRKPDAVRVAITSSEDCARHRASKLS